MSFSWQPMHLAGAVDTTNIGLNARNRGLEGLKGDVSKPAGHAAVSAAAATGRFAAQQRHAASLSQRLNLKDIISALCGPPCRQPGLPAPAVPHWQHGRYAQLAAFAAVPLPLRSEPPLRYWIDEVLWSQGRTAVQLMDVAMCAIGAQRTGGPSRSDIKSGEACSRAFWCQSNMFSCGMYTAPSIHA